MKRKYKLFNSKSNTPQRRRLRSESTESEDLFWMIVRNNRLGYKFRRQYSIGQFVVDFCCPELKLIIEIDGQAHNNDEAYFNDQKRQKYLEGLGFKVKRYLSEDVIKNIEAVYNDLKLYCEKI